MIKLTQLKLSLAIYKNTVSAGQKCNRIVENIRGIKAIEVIFRLRDKQKHYLISFETPCS